MDSQLRQIVDLRDRTLQKSRIAFGLRVGAIERGADKPTNGSFALLKKWEERFLELEKEADQDIRDLIKGVEIIEMMTQVKGIGEILAAKVVAMIDIHKAETVSDLWRYAGYGVIDGQREKPIKGEKLHYNRRLKTTCYLVAGSFLKSNSPYRQVYDSTREYYDANRRDWTKAHKHNAAMRKMIKVWLQHLWVYWRKIEGLPVSQPYVLAHLEHAHYLDPVDFGWPEI